MHQLVKTSQDENTVQLKTHLRDELLPITAETEQMMLQLHQEYQNKTKAYGVFQETSNFQNTRAHWKTMLISWRFSHQSAELLRQELGKYSFANDGTLILCQYNFLATDYLFIRIIR